MAMVLLVGAGGFLGAIARYLVSGSVHNASNGSFQWGILTVNLAGCLLIGFLIGITENHQWR